MSSLIAFLKQTARWPFFGPAFLLLAGLLFLGPHAARTGLHCDDHGFHERLAAADWPAVKQAFLSYVPGRNLHILYYAALYKILGPVPSRLHLAGLVLDLLNVLLAYALIRRIGGGAWLALAAAGLFLLYPNHAETHFWTSAVAMNLLSTTLLLAAFLWACLARLPPAARWGGALGLYALAFFDYDQVFFMWVPFLFCAARLLPEPRPRARHLKAFGGACLLMNAAHVLLRIFYPVSDAGRPVVRFNHIPVSAAKSMIETLAPLRSLPPWDLLRSWAGGPAATLLMAAVLALAWIAAVAVLKKERGQTDRPPYLLMAFGALWFFCAYLPNYFWYISPRHNYLPSFGFLLALGAAAASVLKSRPSWRRPALCGACLVFFASGAATLAQGRAWSLAASLQEDFQRQAPLLLPARPDNLFLIDAPARIAGAPVFKQPEEHLYLFGQAAGHKPASGDFSMTPGRTGVFFGNQVRLFGRDSLGWRSYGGMHVLEYGPAGRLACVSRLRLLPPDGAAFEVALSSDPRCRPLARSVPVWLIDSQDEAAAKSEPLFATSGGAALLSADLKEDHGYFDLRLLWTAQRPVASDFAVVLDLEDLSGKTVFEPVYPADASGERDRETLWPAFDDLHPASSWKPGRALRSVHRFQLKAPLPAGPLRARFTVFERGPSRWNPIEQRRAPLRRL